MKREIMNSIALLLFSAMLLAALTACRTPAAPVDASPAPTEQQAEAPTNEPTQVPVATDEPTQEPTAAPTAEPTEEPTAEPTAEPTLDPTLPDDPEEIGDCVKDAEIVAFLPFADEELGLGYAEAFEIDVYPRYPNAFVLANETLYVLDSVKNRVVVCRKDEGYGFITFSDSDVWNYYMTMAIVDEKIYVCNTEELVDSVSVYDMTGEKSESIPLPKKAAVTGVSALFEMDGYLAMYDHDLTLYILDNGEFIERYDTIVEGVGKPELNIAADGKSYWLNTGENTFPIIIRIIDDLVYCRVRDLNYGESSYRIYNSSGELLGATLVDSRRVIAFPNDPIYISPEGELYIMCLMQDGVYITKPNLRLTYTSHLGEE